MPAPTARIFYDRLLAGMLPRRRRRPTANWRAVTGDQDKPSPSGFRAFAAQSLWDAWGALIALIVAAVATAIYLALFGDESITEELSTIREDAAERSVRPIVNRVVDLRGSGGPSHVLVFWDTRFLGNRAIPTFSSDQVQIYEEHGNDLEMSFSFQPEP
jgi:hypothetical protein